MPKSISATVPSSRSMMLPGFRSRCTTPAVWMIDSAWAISAVWRSAAPGVSASRQLGAEMAERKILHRDVAVLARDAEVVDLGHRAIGDVVQQLELGDEPIEILVARQRTAPAVQYLEDHLLAALGAERDVHGDALAVREAAAHVVAEQPHHAGNPAVAAADRALAREQRALHRGEHLLAAEQPFRYVVERARLDRLHGRVFAALRRQQNHGRIVGIGRDRAQRAQVSDCPPCRRPRSRSRPSARRSCSGARRRRARPRACRSSIARRRPGSPSRRRAAASP